MMIPNRALEVRLLAETVRRAFAQVPYYRKRWRQAWTGIRRLDDLRRLPILSKNHAIRHQRALIADEFREVFAGVVSSGTQRDGGLLRVPRGSPRPLPADDGAELLPQFPIALAPGGATLGAGHVTEGLTLWLAGVSHNIAPRSDQQRLVVPHTYSRNFFETALELLRKPQRDGRRVRYLRTGTNALKTLTAYLAQAGHDPRAFGIVLISTHSNRLSPAWLRWIDERWGAPVLDSFSLSEIDVAANPCAACAHYHWTGPLVTEYLDVMTREPIDARTAAAALVVTTVGPHAYPMPLIRYWTGDLVAVGPRCAAVGGRRGFRSRDRVSSAAVLPAPGEPVVLAPYEAMEWLDGRSEVARHLQPAEQLGIIEASCAGLPKVELEQRRGSLTLRFEVSYDPAMFAVQAGALEADLRHHLVGRSKPLRRLLRAGELAFEVRAVGVGGVRAGWNKWN
ncbi:MAG TPA: hypothetical protein VML75_04810 [Kofleriaceae bacterium]|nr:hypothetical protein [Kofleriaceae bacterium]